MDCFYGYCRQMKKFFFTLMDGTVMPFFRNGSHHEADRNQGQEK
jgi:hypothetical protein